MTMSETTMTDAQAAATPDTAVAPAPQTPRRVLHVGCGPARKRDMVPAFHGDDWVEVRCDIDASAEPDIVANMMDLGVIESGTYDAVYSSHNIEHVFPHEVPIVLREFSRVLKHDGVLVITCPDVQSLGAALSEGRLVEPLYQSPAGPISAIDILWGHRAAIAAGKVYMAHKCGFTAQVLVNTLVQSGFQRATCIQQPEAFALWAVATKAELDEAALEAARRAFLGA